MKKAAAALKRTAKGKRPQFYDEIAVDQLFAVVAALTAEVAVAFDRIDTLERVLVRAGHIDAQVVELFQPDPGAAELRAQRCEELIQRVFAVFESYSAARR